jgi:hypothetical protein
MLRLEGSGSDCTMGAGFREDSVYSTYTLLPMQSVADRPTSKGKLAAGAERADLYRAAHVLAEGIGAEW